MDKDPRPVRGLPRKPGSGRRAGFTLVEFLAVLAGLAALGVVLCLILDCDFVCDLFCDAPSGPLPPVPTALEVTPSAVHVLSPTGSGVRQLRLHAFLRDETGALMWTNENIVWTVTPASGVVSDWQAVDPSFTNVHSAVDIEISAITSGNQSITAVASIPTLTLPPASASITVYAQTDPALLGQDRLSVPVPAPPRFIQQPSIALIDAQLGGCTRDVAVAFVGAAPLGAALGNVLSNVGPQCNEVAVFSAGRAIAYLPPTAAFSWSSSSGDVQPLTPSQPLKMPVKVYIAVRGDIEAAPYAGHPFEGAVRLQAHEAARQIATADVGVANMLFDANRVGLQLDVTYVSIGSAGVSTMNDVPPNIGQGCTAPTTQSATWYDKATVNVYYADKVGNPANIMDAGWRGWACPDVPGEGRVVLMAYGKHSPTALAHEIAHLLALPHLQEPSNLMHGDAPDGMLGADARSHLTVGQMFIMNVDDRSWIFHYPPPPQSPLRSSGKRDCTVVGACPPHTLTVQ